MESAKVHFVDYKGLNRQVFTELSLSDDNTISGDMIYHRLYRCFGILPSEILILAEGEPILFGKRYHYSYLKEFWRLVYVSWEPSSTRLISPRNDRSVSCTAWEFHPSDYFCHVTYLRSLLLLIWMITFVFSTRIFKMNFVSCVLTLWWVNILRPELHRFHHRDELNSYDVLFHNHFDEMRFRFLRTKSPWVRSTFVFSMQKIWDRPFALRYR